MKNLINPWEVKRKTDLQNRLTLIFSVLAVLYFVTGAII